MKTKPTKEDIRIESTLLKAMSLKVNFDKFRPYIDYQRLLPTTKLLLQDYEKYFDVFSHDEIKWDVFTTEFTQHWHTRDLDEYDIVEYRDHAIPLISSVNLDESNNILLSLLDRKYREILTQAISSNIDVAVCNSQIANYIEERSQIFVDGDNDLTLDSVDISLIDKNNGIPWFLPELQKNLGSIVQGQFIVVSAPHGAGKSAFVISQTIAALKHVEKTQKNRPILYFNSEGTKADVWGRMFSNLYHKHIVGGFEEVLDRFDEVKEKFKAAFNYNNLLISQIQTNDYIKVCNEIENCNPCLVIIDICDTLAKDGDVHNLKNLYDSLRLLSAQKCPIIGTSQSGNTSYKFYDKQLGQQVTKNRKELTENDLYGSIPGKGGAADTIITIGIDDDIPDIRYVNVPKKKRGNKTFLTCKLIDKFSLYKEYSI